MFKTISDETFIEQFQDYPAYDNIRKIASVVDGLKNSSRKVVYYCLLNNITKPIKTSQIKARIEEATEYLHGDITGVVETLAKDYVGTNNINLLEPHGNFGTKMVKQTSASRYTFTKPSPALHQLFSKEDLNILERQYFEGNEIEPVYLMPLLPLLLINGSEGISTGYSQKILNRNPKDVVKSLMAKLQGKSTTFKANPWYKGYSGLVVQGDTPNQWLVKGLCEQTNTSTVEITEVPFTYDLPSYVKVLDQLEEKGLIKGYEDRSEENYFFIVKFQREQLANKSNDDLLKLLKLVRPITENYTVEDEHNQVVVYDNPNDVLDHFIKVRLEFLQRKIDYKQKELTSTLLVLEWKRNFINAVIEGSIVISNRKKEVVVKDLDSCDNIQAVDGSYDYLLNMSLMSMTEERIDKLNNEIVGVQTELDYYNTITPSNLYLDQLKEYK